jgi:hypothetical protein
MKKTSLIIFVVVLLAGFLSGQNTSPSVKYPVSPGALKRSVYVSFGTSGDGQLQKAEDLFNSGDFETCAKLLDSLSKITFIHRTKRGEYLSLLAKCYLELDDQVKAEKTVKAMLQNNPHYELVEADNTDQFNHLVHNFEVHPLLSFGARNTLLTPTMKISKVFSVNPNLNYSRNYATSKYLLMYYGWMEIEFRKNWSANFEAILWNLYSYRDLNGSSGWQESYSETMSFSEIPVYIRRYLSVPHFKSFQPYAALGFSWMHMNSATANISNSIPGYTSSGTPIYNFNYNNNLDMLYRRNANILEWLVGAGIGYRIKNIRMTLDWRYFGGLTNLINTAKPIQNQTLVNTYYYADNQIKLNKSELGASISFTFTHSVKKKIRPREPLLGY